MRCTTSCTSTQNSIIVHLTLPEAHPASQVMFPIVSRPLRDPEPLPLREPQPGGALPLSSIGLDTYGVNTARTQPSVLCLNMS